MSKTKKKPPYRLMAPGPVNLPPSVLKSLAEPMIHHRTPEFTKILTHVLHQLRATFGTQQPVMLHTSTGSGAMESAIVNTLSPGDEILVIVSGKFGERWCEIAQAYGLVPHIIKVKTGEAVTADAVDRHLTIHPRARAVLCQVCETSTAVLHPIQEIAAVVSRFENCLFMVDAITAIGATPLPMDEWQLDVVVAGSQKAFMLPTGLAFIALSEKAWRFHKSAKCPRYYWDLSRERGANEKGQTFFSSAVGHIRALEIVLKTLTGKNLLKQIRRSQKLAKSTRAFCTALELKLLAKSPASALTAILVPGGVDGEKWRDLLEQRYNITVMGGQDELKGKILRVGHLGYIRDEDHWATLKALAVSLGDLGYKVERAQLQKALKVARQHFK